MTNYNDGKWHGCNGGECPVDPGTKVEIVFRDSNFNVFANFCITGKGWSWRRENGDCGKGIIIAFRVIEPAVKPDVPNYNDGQWHGWNGGQGAPVDPETIVETVWSNDDGSFTNDYYVVNQCCWTNDSDYENRIVAFRVPVDPFAELMGKIRQLQLKLNHEKAGG